MRSLLVLLLLSSGPFSGITRIHDQNLAVQRGRAAYSRGDFAGAVGYYRAAVEEYGATEDAAVLNLAHACWRAGQPVEARAYYGQLLTSPAPAVRSVAQQQLALLASRRGEYAQAVGLLRQALLANPSNAGARYNYELLHDYLARKQRDPTIPPPAAPAPGGKKPEKQTHRPAEPGEPAAADARHQPIRPTRRPR